MGQLAFETICRKYFEEWVLPALMDEFRALGPSVTAREHDEWVGEIITRARRCDTLRGVQTDSDAPLLVDACRQGAALFVLQGLQLQTMAGKEHAKRDSDRKHHNTPD